MNTPKKLLLITSGGDAPGMNAALRSALRTALSCGITVYGCEGGFQGLVHHRIFPMHSKDAANCIQRGGTILKTGRCEEIKDSATRADCIQYLKQQGIDALTVLGGDGSFRAAYLLEKEGGPKTVGLPCTIDNDIIGTEYTLGFDTACNTALQAIDKIRDTAFSLNSHFLVEVMGRSAGFLAVDVGLAGGAEFILIPEMPMSIKEIVHRITNRVRQKKASIVVVAEAEHAGRSFQIAQEINAQSGISYKVCVLGHVQRGGSPTVKDRKIAALMGYHAISSLMRGESQNMIAMQKETLLPVPFPDPALGARRFAEEKILEINRLICEV